MTRVQQLLADDPLWRVLLEVVALFAIGLLLTMFMITWERKWAVAVVVLVAGHVAAVAL